MSADDKHVDKYFPQKTSWALLEGARDPAAETARAEFARRYVRPVHNYLVSLTRDRQKAEEWCQDFFEEIVLSGKLFAKLDPAIGRFRPYLKQALRNFVISKQRWEGRKKRRPDEDVRPDQWSESGWDGIEGEGGPTPDEAFHQGWVRALLAEALTEVTRICEQRGQNEHLALFLGRYLSDSSEPPSWKDLGAAVGLDEKTARSRADTVARHFRIVLRQILSAELKSEDSIDEELAALLAFV